MATKSQKEILASLPNCPVRSAYDGEPTDIEKIEGERRLKLVIEILAEADLLRLQELMEQWQQKPPHGVFSASTPILGDLVEP